MTKKLASPKPSKKAAMADAVAKSQAYHCQHDDQTDMLGGGTRQVGRPAGAIGKDAKAWRTAMLTKHGDPIDEKIMPFIHQDPIEYAKMLGASDETLPNVVLRIQELQAKMIFQLMPYLRSKMPTDINLTKSGVTVVATVPIQSAVPADSLPDNADTAPTITIEPIPAKPKT